MMKIIQLTEEEKSVLKGVLEYEFFYGHPKRLQEISEMIKPHIESILKKIEES